MPKADHSLQSQWKGSGDDRQMDRAVIPPQYGSKKCLP